LLNGVFFRMGIGDCMTKKHLLASRGVFVRLNDLLELLLVCQVNGNYGGGSMGLNSVGPLLFEEIRNDCADLRANTPLGFFR
jgi:hypothetical protein